MANSIALAQKFQPILDKIYKKQSVTARFDSETQVSDFMGANEVKILKMSVVGLGDYSRATGYKSGDVTAEWETIKLEKDRGRAMHIDRMDNEETLGLTFGNLADEFIRTKVAPEVDAYRFSKWASASGISAATPATLSTAAEVLAAVDAASLQMDEDEVPLEGRILFITNTNYRLLNTAISRTVANEKSVNRLLKVLDELDIVPVPQSRFYTAITMDAGTESDAGGYAKAAAGKDINFMMIHPSARWQATKHANLKVFSPEENQTADGWLFQYRIYHDAGVLENKVDGIYLHNKA